MKNPTKTYLAITLIELLVTLTIIALLIGISFSTLADLKRTNRRQEAHAEIIKLKANIEKMAFNQNKSTIDIASTLPQSTSDINTHILTPNEYYRLSISNIITNKPTGYTINATAIGPQVRDNACSVISLTISTATKDQPTPTECW